MGLYTSINIAATGMSVERLRTDVISNNIANAITTRTQEGGCYRKQSVIVEPIANEHPTWQRRSRTRNCKRYSPGTHGL